MFVWFCPIISSFWCRYVFLHWMRWRTSWITNLDLLGIHNTLLATYYLTLLNYSNICFIPFTFHSRADHFPLIFLFYHKIDSQIGEFSCNGVLTEVLLFSVQLQSFYCNLNKKRTVFGSDSVMGRRFDWFTCNRFDF